MFQVSKTKDSCSSQSSRIWYQHDGNFLWVLIISVIINVESYVLPRCRHVFWSKYRILKRELYWECRYRQQRQSPVGEGGGGGGLWESCPGKFLKLRCLKMTFPAYWGQTCQFVVMSHFFKKNLGFTQTPEPSRFVKPPMSKNQNCQAWVVAYRSWSLARAYIIIGLKLCLISIIMVTAETHPLTEMFYSM